MGVYPLNVRRYDLLLKPNKAETLVFGCQCSDHKIERSDEVMKKISVSLTH